MLNGISQLDFGRLCMSLGYGTHKKGRPLSPIEVATLLRQACDAGHTLGECAREIKIDQTGLTRFLSILKLPNDLKHLVDWGGGKDKIGFTCATELTRISGSENQRMVAKAVLQNGLNSREVRQIAQLIVRSGRLVEACLQEILGMRPAVKKRYILIGTITDARIRAALNCRSQRERDKILHAALGEVGLRNSSGRLGNSVFTLVGDESFGELMNELGTDHIEGRLCKYMAERLENAETNR